MADPRSSGPRGGSGSPSAAPKPRYGPVADELLFVIYVAIGIFALCVLISVPRLLARFLSGTRAGELGKGIWFGDKGRRNSPIRQYATGLKPNSPVRPKHFPALEEVLPGSSVLGVHIPYTNGYTAGQLVILAVYAGLVGFAISFKKWAV